MTWLKLGSKSLACQESPGITGSVLRSQVQESIFEWNASQPLSPYRRISVSLYHLLPAPPGLPPCFLPPSWFLHFCPVFLLGMLLLHWHLAPGSWPIVENPEPDTQKLLVWEALLSCLQVQAGAGAPSMCWALSKLGQGQPQYKAGSKKGQKQLAFIKYLMGPAIRMSHHLHQEIPSLYLEQNVYFQLSASICCLGSEGLSQVFQFINFSCLTPLIKKLLMVHWLHCVMYSSIHSFLFHSFILYLSVSYLCKTLGSPPWRKHMNNKFMEPAFRELLDKQQRYHYTTNHYRNIECKYLLVMCDNSGNTEKE